LAQKQKGSAVAGAHRLSQAEINALLMVQAGWYVVRLKGGGPFVFGRGGEEAAALRAAGVPYIPVPWPSRLMPISRSPTGTPPHLLPW